MVHYAQTSATQDSSRTLKPTNIFNFYPSNEFCSDPASLVALHQQQSEDIAAAGVVAVLDLRGLLRLLLFLIGLLEHHFLHLVAALVLLALVSTFSGDTCLALRRSLLFALLLSECLGLICLAPFSICISLGFLAQTLSFLGFSAFTLSVSLGIGSYSSSLVGLQALFLGICLGFLALLLGFFGFEALLLCIGFSLLP